LQNEPIEEINVQTGFGTINAFKAQAENFGAKTKNVIIAMHGDGADSENTGWIPVMKNFASSGYTIYSLSMPGYGKSTGKRDSFRHAGTQVILDFMKAEKIQKTIIMGRSVGGRTSIEFACHHADKTVGVIL